MVAMPELYILISFMPSFGLNHYNYIILNTTYMCFILYNLHMHASNTKY